MLVGGSGAPWKWGRFKNGPIMKLNYIMISLIFFLIGEEIHFQK